MQTKFNKKSALLALSLSIYFPLSAVVLDYQEYDVANYKEQLYKEVSLLEFGVDENNNPIYYKVQQSNNPYLYLGANEVFFSPIGKLTSVLGSKNPDLDLNKGEEYEYIKNLFNANDQIEWGFITTNFGNIHADFILSGTTKDIGAVLSFQIDQKDPVEVTITNDMLVAGNTLLDFPDIEQGFHTFKITVITPKTRDLNIINVRLSGQGSIDSYVVRERWRPSAAYSTWASSKNRRDVKAWIMELSSDSELGHYSPCTTEFGYFGPIFKPGGSSTRVNMSIWSSGSNEPLLPFNKQSHILGIGSSDGIFSSWSHEGNGAKADKWNVFETNTSKKYVIGLRFVDDGDFNTFYGYFWNEQTENWQLYSVGRKLKKEVIKSLKTKAFIEVVGGAMQERSNHKSREVRYKGWVCNSKGVWHDLNRAIIPPYTDVTNETRGITEDGESFFTSTGGLKNTLQPNVSTTLQKQDIVNRPLYMDPLKLENFFKVPFIPKITGATINADGTIKVDFQTNTEFESDVTLCWGTQDALSNQKNWDMSTSFSVPANDSDYIHSIEIPASLDTKFLRILVRDQRAQMWSFETFTVGSIN
jgi:hypothetical protein